MSPTTDDDDKYEEYKRREAMDESARQKNVIFYVFAAIFALLFCLGLLWLTGRL